ncbi:MAG: hypothetical protein PHT88_00115 [Candidatus Moranbacteria bacterium]|nr:hypothetical protein [Candidatus Moranbacteria bacterium]
MKTLLTIILFVLCGFAAAEDFLVGNIGILPTGHYFSWSDQEALKTHGFVEPLGADEEVFAIVAHSTRLCFANSTISGTHTDKANALVIPKTANNDKTLYYSGIIKNTATGAVREVSLLVDNWAKDVDRSLDWTQADGLISYGVATDAFIQPTISYEGGSIVVRFNANVLSGFVVNGVPVCDINPDNIKSIILSTDGAKPIAGNLTLGTDQNYVIAFPGVKPGALFTIRLVMYKNSTNYWLDMSFFAPDANNSVTFLPDIGKLTAN